MISFDISLISYGSQTKPHPRNCTISLYRGRIRTSLKPQSFFLSCILINYEWVFFLRTYLFVYRLSSNLLQFHLYKFWSVDQLFISKVSGHAGAVSICLMQLSLSLSHVLVFVGGHLHCIYISIFCTQHIKKINYLQKKKYLSAPAGGGKVNIIRNHEKSLNTFGPL